MNERSSMFELVQPCASRQDQRNEHVPDGIDGHAQKTDGGLGHEIHIGLEDLSQHGDEEQSNLWIEKRNGKAFCKAFGRRAEVFIEQRIVIGVPHGPTVPHQQGATDQLQASEDRWGFFEQDDEAKHGHASVKAETQAVAQRTHDALATTADHRVAEDHHQTGSGRYGAEEKHGACRQEHVPGHRLHGQPKGCKPSTLAGFSEEVQGHAVTGFAGLLRSGEVKTPTEH